MLDITSRLLPYGTIESQIETLPPPYFSNVTGRNLAHGKRSVAQRAFIAADLHRGRASLMSPTIRQAAILANICVPYVAAAVVIADDLDTRGAVLTGDVSLLDAAKTKKHPAESLAEHMQRATHAEWLEAARTIGTAPIWDYMISPLI